MQEFAVRSRPPASVVTRSAPAVQRCGDHACPPGGCNKEEEQRLARSATGPAPRVAPPIVHEVIRSPGEPLPASLNEGMSALFGHDFARVQVHTGARAADSAASVAARAYTVGPHVVLGRSAPDLHSPAGQQLLAHELTHVMQQPAAVPAGDLPISRPDDTAEREAAATRAAPFRARPSVQRQVAPDDQEEEERKARSSDAGNAADAPAPAPPQDVGTAVPPQDAGTVTPPQDAGTAAPPQDAGTAAQPQDAGTSAQPQDAGPGAAPAPAPTPPACREPACRCLGASSGRSRPGGLPRTPGADPDRASVRGSSGG